MMIRTLLMGIDTVDPRYYPENAIAALTQLTGISSAQALGAIIDEFYGSRSDPVASDRAAVEDAFNRLKGEAVSGDTVVCCYTGHGLVVHTTVPSAARFANEAILGPELIRNRFWTTAVVLADGLMLADQYNRYLGLLDEGITVVNIVDSCNSGTFYSQFLSNAFAMGLTGDGVTTVDPRASDPLATQLYRLQKDYYDGILARGPGSLRVAGVQIASTPAGMSGVGGEGGATLTDSISDAIRYGEAATYKDLFCFLSQSLKAKNEDSPRMYAFGLAGKNLLDQPVFGVTPLRLPDPKPGA